MSYFGHNLKKKEEIKHIYENSTEESLKCFLM